ncbi:MAG: hypothetical protein CVV41_10055 [Candidatus Riflebacteria bacterium HGW-Riflebacteria-1]|jgi:tetratricopeptide (TPR) repeat protein|nr:MAG: hypothetical protein CVV41_10055 [Candidatus Riflebacteria bacterium HGW-Riflebacteria-1]
MNNSIKQIRNSFLMFAVCATLATAPSLLADQAIAPVPAKSAVTTGKASPATVDPASLGSLALVNEGARLLAAGETKEAEVVLGQAVGENPNSPEALYNFGLALSFNNKFAEAVQAQLKAVELKAQFPEAYLALGNLYLSVDENEQALSAFEQAHQLAHNEHVRRSALFNKGTVLGRLDRFLEAEMVFSECLALDPTDTSPAFALANLHLRQGNYEVALGWLDSVSNDFLLETSFLRCRLQLKLKDAAAASKAFSEARKVLDEAKGLDPEHRVELVKALEEMAKELSELN